MKTTQTLSDFLATPNGQRAVAAMVGVRSTDPALDAQARYLALHWLPRRELRSWTLGDLIDASLVIGPAGTYAAKEVTL